MNVDLPALELDVPDSRNYVEGQVRYYRVDVEEGLDLRLTLTSNQSSPSNEVALRHLAKMPTLSDFEFSGAEPFSDSQQFFVPSTQAGTYYVMVLARDANATEMPTLFLFCIAVFDLRGLKVVIIWGGVALRFGVLELALKNPLPTYLRADVSRFSIGSS